MWLLSRTFNARQEALFIGPRNHDSDIDISKVDRDSGVYKLDMIDWKCYAKRWRKSDKSNVDK